MSGSLAPLRDLNGSDEGTERSKSTSPGNKLSDIWKSSSAEEDDRTWRAVGAPRRASVASISTPGTANSPNASNALSTAFPPYPASNLAIGSQLQRSSSQNLDIEYQVSPPISGRQQGSGSSSPVVQGRGRASSVPLPYLGPQVDLEAMSSGNEANGSMSGSSPQGAQAKWSGGLPWGQGKGIWQKNGGGQPGTTSSDDAEADSPIDQLIPASPATAGRQHRSLSFSLGTFRTDDDNGLSNRVGTEPLNDIVGTRSLGTGPRNSASEPAYGYGLPRTRNRSQSSSAVFGIEESYDLDESSAWPDDSKRSPGSMRPPTVSGPASQQAVVAHRRSLSMTQNENWDKDYPPTTIPLASGDDDVPRGARPLQRRFSHSPQLYFDHAAMPNRPGGDEEEAPAVDTGRRRHSLGAPVLYGDQGQELADSFSSMRVNDDGTMVMRGQGANYGYDSQGNYGSQPLYAEEINDYFENQEHRARAWVEGARNLQMQQYSQRWPIYVVEFKAGRKDFFFLPENSGFTPKKGDFVVVEADRGKDLGKVVHDSIRSQAELQAYQQLHAANFLDNHVGKEIHAKRLYRPAQPAELTMLAAKMADEEKAMNICQNKVRSKRLPMEVVDAEYQWDRRKLTFYFVADRRIDFRELVRDLFKIYKTRIWLCSCGGQVGRPEGSSSDDSMPSSPPRSMRDYSSPSSSGRELDYSPMSSGPGNPMSPPMGSVAMPPFAFRPMTLGPPAPMGYAPPMQPAMPYGMPPMPMGPRMPSLDTRR